MMRYAVAALATSVFLLPAWLSADAPTAFADELLHISSQVTYDIQPDQGPVHVSWQVSLDNNDPDTLRGDSGSVSYYASITVPILRGATLVRATGPAGVALSIDIDSSGEGPIDIAEVTFDRRLYYEETYAFELTYDLVAGRDTALLATDSYIFLPAIASGDRSEVRITTPSDPNWEVTVEAVDCPVTPGGVFSCGASEFVQVAAFVEVARAGVLNSSSFSVPLAAGDLAVTLRHFPGEEAWAAHMRELTEAALPVLEELFGAAYQGPLELEIAERGRQQIAGYEGTFGCLFDSCVIGISPLAGDVVALHELAHLWTQPFESRWIAEGLAEFMSERAAESLPALVERHESLTPPVIADLQLDNWGRSHHLIGASQDELLIEETGYYKSRTFIEVLVATAGLDALQAANAEANTLGGGIDSETYLGLLEEASGLRLDGLFLDAVFPASYGPALEQRRDLQDRLEALRPDAQRAGFGLPARIGQLIGEWEFDEAEGLLSAAERALQTYIDARERVRQPRDFWTDIGLVGRDPDAALGEAADAFAAAEFSKSERLARDATSQIDGARRDGLVRFLIGAGALALVLAGVVGVVLIARSRPSVQ